jgi:transcriptional regulator with XRE-family HTH domain
MVSSEFGAMLRALRLREGYSQRQLGLAIGVHRTMLSHLEKGDRYPSIPTIIKLTDALNLHGPERVDLAMCAIRDQVKP